MKGHSFIDHTADVGIKVWADGREALFEEAASAMLELIVNRETVQPDINKTLRLEADNTEKLFLKWLKEILFILEKFSVVFATCRVQKIKPSNQTTNKLILTAILSGERIDPTRHDICTEIKAVTLHDFYLQEHGSVWEARVLFDI